MPIKKNTKFMTNFQCGNLFDAHCIAHLYLLLPRGKLNPSVIYAGRIGVKTDFKSVHILNGRSNIYISDILYAVTLDIVYGISGIKYCNSGY